MENQRWWAHPLRATQEESLGQVEPLSRWFHTIDLPDGSVTPGVFDTRVITHLVPWPSRLRGGRCLDVGTADGFWAFEMERRGAREIIAIDIDQRDPRDLCCEMRAEPAISGREDRSRSARHFEIARQALNSGAHHLAVSIYDLDPRQHGLFDVIFCGTLLLHLRDPVGALERLAAVCRGDLVIVECIDVWLDLASRGVASARLSPAPQQWWRHNRSGLMRTLRMSGFEPVEVSQPFITPLNAAAQRRGLFNWRRALWRRLATRPESPLLSLLAGLKLGTYDIAIRAIPVSAKRASERSMHRIVDRALGFIAKVWAKLPVDGAAVLYLGPRSHRRLLRQSKHYAWRRVPRCARVFAIPLARLLWLFACPIKTLAAIRTIPTRLSARHVCRALWLGWTRGKSPAETMMLSLFSEGEGLHGPRLSMLADGLDGWQSVLLLAALGNAEERAFASDKRALSDALMRCGIPVPPILAEIVAGTSFDPMAPPWSDTGRLFVKPRHGRASLGIAVIERLSDGTIRLDGEEVSADQMARNLLAGANTDALLVQPFIETSGSLVDISPRAPPWLRITVCRLPGGEPVVLSGNFMLPTKSHGADWPCTSVLRAPIDPRSGALLHGFLPDQPRDRLSHVPWNGARIHGRAIEEWHEACHLALRGSALFANVPIVGWDVLLGREGPIVAEANTGIALSDAELFYFATGLPSPLIDILLGWVAEREAEMSIMPHVSARSSHIRSA